MPRTLRRPSAQELSETTASETKAENAIFDTAYVARSLDRLIAGRMQDLDTLRQMALDLNANPNSEGLHKQLMALARSAHDAYDELKQSREVLVGLHKQASGGTVVAAVDKLTGLANRAAFSAHLTSRLSVLQSTGTLSLVFVEFGALKLLTSEMGHGVSNRLVKRFGAILRRSVKRTDYVARMGLQHFAMVFEDVLPEKAVSIALRIHDAIESKMLPNGGSAAGMLSITMGIAAASGPGSTADDLMRKASDAIVQARKEGRTAIYVA